MTNLPAGATHDPSAPFNQEEEPEFHILEIRTYNNDQTEVWWSKGNDSGRTIIDTYKIAEALEELINLLK